MSAVWNHCRHILNQELSDQDFNAWIGRLHAVEEGEQLQLFAPNPFVLDHIQEHFYQTIESVVRSADNKIVWSTFSKWTVIRGQ